jgi:integrase
MDRVRLTPARIRDFTCPPGKAQAFLWDTESPRLAVRATPGAKSYIFEAKLEGKTIRLTIGSCESWPLTSVWSGKGDERQEVQRGAREEAARLAGLVDQGTDPRQVKADQRDAARLAREAKAAEATRREEQAQREAITVGSAWLVYIEARAPRWSAHHLRDHHTTAATQTAPRQGKPGGPAPIAALLPLRLAGLTAERLEAWQRQEAATRPGSAALAYRLVRAFLRWCGEQAEYRGLVDPAALLTKRVREAVPTVGTKSDCLQREQLPAWFAAVGQLSNPVIAAYLQALLLTGARREELGTLTWANVDFQWASLTIKDKVDGERVIPLTPYVAALLAALPRRNPWVFSSPTAAAGRLIEPRIAHNRALLAAGLPELSLHGLRRSFGTLAEWTECPTGIVAQIMGHKPSALAEKHYRRRPLDLLRKWHTAIEAFILTEAGLEQPKAQEQGQAPRLRVVA